jgi:hypothetical protein
MEHTKNDQAAVHSVNLMSNIYIVNNVKDLLIFLGLLIISYIRMSKASTPIYFIVGR